MEGWRQCRPYVLLAHSSERPLVGSLERSAGKSELPGSRAQLGLHPSCSALPFSGEQGSLGFLLWANNRDTHRASFSQWGGGIKRKTRIPVLVRILTGFDLAATRKPHSRCWGHIRVLQKGMKWPCLMHPVLSWEGASILHPQPLPDLSMNRQLP